MARASNNPALFAGFSNGEVGDILVGHVVAVSKSAENTVVRAKADDADRMPAIGFVKRVNASKVIVQLNAVYRWPSTVNPGIESGKEYWVGTTAGGITDDPSTISSGLKQLIGVGKKSPRHLIVRMDPLGISL